MKSKKILVAIIGLICLIAIVITILIATGVIDIFKSDKDLFYEYLFNINIDTNIVDQYNIARKRIEENTNSSTLNINLSNSVYNTLTGVSDVETLLELKSNGLKNALLNQEYRDLIFSNNGQNFLTLKFVKDNNLYGIIADNILAKYLTIENLNLKKLASNLGVQNTTLVPNYIPENYDNILELDETTLENVKQVYFSLIYDNIDETHFYKIKNADKTETFVMSLSEQELINLTKLVLDTLKNDTTLLNIYINKLQETGSIIKIEDVQLTIQGYIDNLSKNTYSAEKDFIKLSLNTNKKQVTSVKVEIKDETDIYSLSININSQNKIIGLVTLNNKDIAKFEIEYVYNNDNLEIKLSLRLKEENQVEFKNAFILQYNINNYQSDNIIENMNIKIQVNEENYEITYNNKVELKNDVQITKLTTENSVKLNDISSEDLNKLFMAIKNRIIELYQDDLMLVSSKINQLREINKKH